MDIRPSNPCIRCGKERKVVKTWKENSGTSLITCTTMTCPDPSCQAIVDRRLAVQKNKREEMELARLNRKNFTKGIPAAVSLVKKA